MSEDRIFVAERFVNQVLSAKVNHDIPLGPDESSERFDPINWLVMSTILRDTVNENYFYQFINTHEIIYTKKNKIWH